MSIMMSMGVGIIMAAMVLLPQNVWGHAFSKEQEVLDRVSRVAPYLAAVTILNCIQVVLSGVMRGIGLQKVGAYTNLGAYYGVGLATAMILIFVFQFDGRGLWIGMLCGVTAQTVALTTISLFLNWESLVTHKPSHCQLFFPFLGLGHGIPSHKIQIFGHL
jgi:MATE family multidrug resistance protein